MHLYVLIDGTNPDALASAATAGADCIVLDLAAAPPGALEAARSAARGALAARPPGGPRMLVRTADIRSGRTIADLDAVMPARPDGILLPDCLDGADIQHLGALLAVREAENGLDDGSTRILAEAGATPSALFRLGTLPRASLRLDGLVFDAGALAESLGASLHRASTGHHAGPIGHARSQVLFAAAAGGIAAFERTPPDASAGAALEASARCARRDGFSGMIATDLVQLPVIRRAFG